MAHVIVCVCEEIEIRLNTLDTIWMFNVDTFSEFVYDLCDSFVFRFEELYRKLFV